MLTLLIIMAIILDADCMLANFLAYDFHWKYSLIINTHHTYCFKLIFKTILHEWKCISKQIVNMNNYTIIESSKFKFTNDIFSR